MQFQVNEWVVCSGIGIGRVVGLVTRSFSQNEGQLYYEVQGNASTVWVQAAPAPARGLRRLTRKDELAHFRAVLRGQPADMHANFRQRQLDVREQMRQGTLQATCELVRDLNARSWRKPLSEAEGDTLRKSTEALCHEWAAADGVPFSDAAAEVSALLLEARRDHFS